MSYLVIESFPGGVDRRRPIYAGKPGTLWSCVNAHITMGGDIEKRKAFVLTGDFSADTFGLFAVRDALYTFGSVAAPVSLPSGVTYQKLSYGGAAMTKLLDADLFDGKIYAIARFGDGSVQHFYDGALVVAWNNGIVRASMGGLAGVASALSALIDASANFVATVLGTVITVTAANAGTPFTASTFAENGGSVGNQTMTSANIVANVAPVSAAAASFTFAVQGGSGAGALTNLTVGGVEVLNVGVNWAVSNTAFAAAIAAQITAFASAPEYTATSSGEAVTVTAALTGVAANSLSVVATTTGTGRAGTQIAAGTNGIGVMTGGVVAIAAVAQVNTLTLGGTFDLGDRFGVTLTSNFTIPVVEYFGNSAQPWGNATCVKTHMRKLYAGADSILQFCKVNDPTLWNSDVDAGAGFINVANHDGGSEAIPSLEIYQGRLAVFSRRTIQLWTMQNDDTLNVPNQIMRNTGTRAAHSTMEFAGNDVFYLDDVGIRSIRARDASNNAFTSGVGGSINKVVRDWMATGASQSEIEGAFAVVEPTEARLWMSIGTRVFVYSYYPETHVAAWTWYEPGFVVSDFAVTTNRVWARGTDNNLYLYGGNSGSEYGADYLVEVEFPFTTAQKPGTIKDFRAMDMAADGEWSCQWRTDPNELNNLVQMGTYDGVTFPKATWDGVGCGTHIAPVLRHQGEGYAAISQIALYYDPAGEAG